MDTENQERLVLFHEQSAILHLKKIRFAIVAMFFILAALLSGCSFTPEPESAEPVVPELVSGENILDFMKLVGKGLSENEILAEHSESITATQELEISGDLFGAPADGTIYFRDYPEDEKELIASNIYLSFYEGDLFYDDCRAELIAVYGLPSLETMDPYVKSIGGCVSHCIFESGEYQIELEKASEHNYCYIDISLISDRY